MSSKVPVILSGLKMGTQPEKYCYKRWKYGTETRLKFLFAA
jgi:hypothetical protein